MYTKFIILIILLFCTGCSSSADRIQYQQTDYGSVLTDEMGRTYYFDKLPMTMNYNESVLYCNSVELYQDETEHGYSAYAIVNVDISGLTDDDIYWIDKDKAIETSLSITSEDNKFDSEYMDDLSIYDNGDTRKYIFWIIDEYRYDLTGSEINIYFRIKQDETYEYIDDEGETYNFNKDDCFSHTFSASSLKPSDEIDKITYDEIMNKLQNLKEIYSNLLD